MKFEEKYLKRLLKLARHLSAGRLYEKFVPMTPPDGLDENQPPVFPTEDGGLTFAYFPFLVDELPYIFNKHFAMDNNGKPFLKKHPKLEPDEAFILFFGLSAKEFLHIGTPLAQQPKFGGILELPYYTAPPDVGYQIFELVRIYTLMN
jgi:hypothetical protein